MNVDPIGLHTTVRHETGLQTTVADLLRDGSPRHHAAVELDTARNDLLQAELQGAATDSLRWRLRNAEAVCDALNICAWAVAS